MYTHEDCQHLASTKVLLKNSCLISTEDRGLPGAQQRGQTSRDFIAEVLCADVSLKGPEKKCMRGYRNTRVSVVTVMMRPSECFTASAGPVNCVT